MGQSRLCWLCWLSALSVLGCSCVSRARVFVTVTLDVGAIPLAY